MISSRIILFFISYYLFNCFITVISIHSIELYQSTIPSHKIKNVINNIKLRQIGGSFLETNNTEESLHEQILTEKHLATYYGLVDIGKSQARCLFDTGSSEFWTISDECNTQRCLRHKRFPHVQAGEKLSGDSMQIKYLSGKVLGNIVMENIKIGDVTVVKQPCGIASVVDIILLDDVDWECILGLAYPNKKAKNSGVLPLFDNIMKQNVLHQLHLSNQFSYYLDQTHGSLTLGGVNCKYLNAHPPCANLFHFTPVIDQGYWTVSLVDVTARYPDGSEKGNVCPPTGCPTIIDTGTYLIYGPQMSYHNLLGQLDIKGCDKSNLPTIFFHFYVGSGQSPLVLSLKPEQYVLQFSTNGHDECVAGISPDQDVIWTLGQVFIRSYYTLFDREHNQVGFAPIPLSSSSLTISSPLSSHTNTKSHHRFQRTESHIISDH